MQFPFSTNVHRAGFTQPIIFSQGLTCPTRYIYRQSPTLCLRGIANGIEGHQPTGDLHKGDHDGRSDQPQGGMDNFQNGSRLRKGEPCGHWTKAIDRSTGGPTATLPKALGRQSQHDGPSRTTSAIVGHQIQILQRHGADNEDSTDIQ